MPADVSVLVDDPQAVLLGGHVFDETAPCLAPAFHEVHGVDMAHGAQALAKIPECRIVGGRRLFRESTTVCPLASSMAMTEVRSARTCSVDLPFMGWEIMTFIYCSKRKAGEYSGL